MTENKLIYKIGVQEYLLMERFYATPSIYKRLVVLFAKKGIIEQSVEFIKGGFFVENYIHVKFLVPLYHIEWFNNIK